MKKVVMPIIIISLILVIIFQSVLSANAIFINKEKDKLIENNYKDYRNCKISTKHDNIVGRAFLFPGFLSSGWWSGSYVNVKRASGILIEGDSDWTVAIFFNDDHYYNNWVKAYVFSFTGYFSNKKNFLMENVFEINGTAKFVRVYTE